MGIASYQGSQVGEQPLAPEDTKVEDYMTKDVLSFREDQSILTAIQLLIQKNISGAPVVNAQNKLVGIISEGDCIKRISDSRYYNMPIDNIDLKTFMITKVETVLPDMNLFDVANKFLKEKKRRFPVCKNGELIGIISQKDILKATIELSGNRWKK